MWNYEFKYGKDWIKQPLFFNTATGASVTGFARAHLLDAMHTVGSEKVIYCDTDSLVLHPCNISGLALGPELGQWELEGEASIGHFAGKKLYAMKLKELAKDGKPKFKIASKGSKLNFEQMERVVKGETVEWENEAPTFSIANGVNFVKRNIRSTAVRKEK